MVPSRAGARADRVRRLLAPAIALLAASLALCCLTTLPSLVSGWPLIGTLDPAVPAWAGLALLAGMAVVIVTLLAARRLGAGPPLALGSVAAILGLALSHDPESGPQIVLGLLTMTVAFGALVSAGLCLLEELGAREGRRAFVCWLVPLAAGWGVLGWFALRTTGSPTGSPTGSLGVHPPTWLVAAAAALVLGWAVLSIVLEPPRSSGSLDAGAAVTGWENAWATLAVLCAGVGTVVMLVGFQPDPVAPWVRPVVLLTTGVAVVGLLGCARMVPSPGARPAYLAVATALLTGPTTLHMMVLVSAQAQEVPWWVCPALLVGGLAGCWVGLRRPGSRGGSPLGTSLLVMALAVAAGWVLPSNPLLMCAAATPLAFGLACTVAAGLDLAAVTRMGVRYTTAGAAAALLFGLLAAGPLAWALGAALTGPPPAARDGGRVLLGLAFALLILASAGVSVLMGRNGRTVPLRPTCHREPDLVDLPSGGKSPVG